MDEVTIISAVLDLRSKAVSTIMTPIDDVFTLSTDDILDEAVVDKVIQKRKLSMLINH
jgi:CBS domain containing-hemolysin-like protein